MAALEGGQRPRWGRLALALGSALALVLFVGAAWALWSPGRESPGAGAPETPAPPRVSPSPTASARSLLIDLEEGQRQRGSFRRRASTGRGSEDLEWVVEQVVLRRDSREIEIQATVERGAFTKDGVVVFDSQRPELSASPHRELQSLIGCTYSVVHDRRSGRVVRLRGGERVQEILEKGGVSSVAGHDLGSFFTIVFGVLPGESRDREAWSTRPLSRRMPMEAKATQLESGVSIRVDHSWTKDRNTLRFEGRYLWRGGQLVESEAVLDGEGHLVRLPDYLFRWRLLREGR